jgi:hypothetical protein
VPQDRWLTDLEVNVARTAFDAVTENCTEVHGPSGNRHARSVSLASREGVVRVPHFAAPTATTHWGEAARIQVPYLAADIDLDERVGGIAVMAHERRKGSHDSHDGRS